MLRFREILLGPSYFFHRKLISLAKKSKYKVYCSFFESRHSSNHITTKKELKAEVAKCSGGFFGLLKKIYLKRITTGGTTGEPFAFYIGRFFRRQKERAYIFDIWSSVGYKPFDLRVILRGGQGNKLVKYNWKENAYEISVNKLNNADDYIELYNFLLNLDEFFLHVYPSTLLTLTNNLTREQISKLKINGVFAGSESFPTEQIYALEKKYNFKIAHWYGHSEYAVLAFFCKSCNGFHFYPTYGFVKLLPEDDKTHCKILATSYNLLGTRFCNYDTKDVALVTNTKCNNCNYVRIEKILGRDQEFFIDKFGEKKAFGPFLFGIHNDFWIKLQDIQFIQSVQGEIIVNICCPEIECSFIKATLLNRFTCVDLIFRFSEKVVRSTSNKRQYFIQKLTL